MTNKPLKTKGLRRLKQEERPSPKEEVKMDQKKIKQEAEILRQGRPKLSKPRRGESRRMRYTSTRPKLDRKVS